MALVEAVAKCGQRAFVGKVCMDRNAPTYVTSASTVSILACGARDSYEYDALNTNTNTGPLIRFASCVHMHFCLRKPPLRFLTKP